LACSRWISRPFARPLESSRDIFPFSPTRMRLATVVLALPAVALLGTHRVAPAPRYTKLYTLKPKEGVFAYARISPDGRTLVYASEKSDARHPRGIKTAETVVDVATKKILYTEDGIDAYWSS